MIASGINQPAYGEFDRLLGGSGGYILGLRT
jgi:hypothetical protein